MNIHEYQAKALLAEYNIPVPAGSACMSPDDCTAAAKKLGGDLWVVKAQIHAGGRGKAGGVKVASSIEEVSQHAHSIQGMNLISKQTGPQGHIVKRLLVEEAVDIARELYVGMLVDRSRQQIALLASTEGGTEIEEVAAATPEKILTAYAISANSANGFNQNDLTFIAEKLGLSGPTKTQAIELFNTLLQLFIEKDASLVEINPLVITPAGDIIALDAKMNFDDNALYRHPEINDLNDPDEQDPDEIEAAKYDLSYIPLDGNIGCMVNGAGLAMATMDIIKLYGSEPANFLDVGGGATVEKVTNAFQLMLKNPHIKAILVNIFGGIMRCDIIAEGLITAARDIHLSIPLVVRLEGTNAKQGKKLLADSGLSIIAADDMADAAKKAVDAAEGQS
ncbi:MAG TPA: ADP-forming succinate--CoA ligase subunit beta [Gammaproteobacteria bacterium]|nr:ADP-forming succinate--CoA ligase subunit beta [Gammaproteobacteria bacterium]